MPEPHEQAALDFASAMAGEYIDSIGKTDLASFTSEEWMILIEVIATNYLIHYNAHQPCPF